jgi:flagellar basal-body rod protein FlgG
MVNGLPSAVSGMHALWQRQEVVANNLANVSTPGFKKDDLLLVPAVSPPAQTTAAGGPPSSALPPTIQWTDHTQGLIHATGRELDVALNGSGFLAVQTPAGTRYTRNGTLNVGPGGFLVTPSGARVLGDGGPIAVPPGRITIGTAGEVQVDGKTVGTLQVAEFPKPYRFFKEGDSLFVPASPDASPRPATGTAVVSGALEGSNVNPVEAMVSMIEILRTYEAAQKVIQMTDDVNRQAANEIGRVS